MERLNRTGLGNKRANREYWHTPEGLALLTGWRRDGLSLPQIADRCGLSFKSLRNLIDTDENVKNALKQGAEIVDYMVENALLKRALGYTTRDVKVTVGKKLVNGETYEVLKETTEKRVPPDVSAAIFWLNNRKNDKWMRNRDNVGGLSEEDSGMTITILRGNEEETEELPPERKALPEQRDEVNRGVTFMVEPKREPTQEELDAWPEDWDEREAEDYGEYDG